MLENHLDDNKGAPFANVLENQSELRSSRVPEIFFRISQTEPETFLKIDKIGCRRRC